MANPMNTDQFRVAAKAAVDESEFHSLLLDIYLSFLSLSLSYSSFSKQHQTNKLIQNYQQSPTTMTTFLIIELLLMLSPAI